MDHNKMKFSPLLGGVLVFWSCCALFLLGWVLSSIAGALLLAFIVPIIYGSHEALHDTLIPRKGFGSKFRTTHNNLALTVGFALQGMNFKLLRPGHLHHHYHGRHDEGYAPDVVPGKLKFQHYVTYYTYLFGLPALAWQLVGFAKLIIPPRFIPFAQDIPFHHEHSKVPYIIPQLAVALFFVYAILVGGWMKFFLFEMFFCFTWSVLQNVSHYGLCGIDPTTDRVCARTYILEEPFHTLTFGSTSHLAHHVDMSIPGAYLNKQEVLEDIKTRLGVEIQIKRGVLSFLLDIARQFKGPLSENQLSTSWITSVNSSRRQTSQIPESFGYRQGRTWAKDVDETSS